MEIPLSIEMKKARWRAFGHILRLHEKTPCKRLQPTISKYHRIQKDIGEEKGVLSC